MKQVEKAIETLIVSKAQTIVTLRDVNINGEIGKLTFKKYSTEQLGFTAYGLLPHERMFLIVERNGKDNITFEFMTKEEGNSIYKYVKDTREFNFDE